MNILITPDKFKGCLTSAEVTSAISNGIMATFSSLAQSDISDISIREIQMADGGDGSLDVVEKYFKGKRMECISYNPLGRMINVEYLMNEKHAFIEMAQVSGLELLKNSERNPLYTSTFGLGVVIMDAVRNGADTISLSIGGSATNDCGAGMLQALGMSVDLLQGSANNHITGGMLRDIVNVNLNSVYDFVRCNNLKFRVICDVDNPLLGERGATYVYGPQKGADSAALKILESGVKIFANFTDNADESAKNIPGAGAAGGVGYAMSKILDAEIVSGSKFFAELTGLKESIDWADLVISGEGCVDSQSFNGKVVGTVYDLCCSYKKPLVLLCGICSLNYNLNGVKILDIISVAKNKEDSINNASLYITKLSKGILKTSF